MSPIEGERLISSGRVVEKFCLAGKSYITQDLGNSKVTIRMMQEPDSPQDTGVIEFDSGKVAVHLERNGHKSVAMNSPLLTRPEDKITIKRNRGSHRLEIKHVAESAGPNIIGLHNLPDRV